MASWGTQDFRDSKMIKDWQTLRGRRIERTQSGGLNVCVPTKAKHQYLKEEGGLFSGVLDEAGPNSFLWSSWGVNGLWVLTALKAFRASLMISALVFCLHSKGR